MVSFCTGISSPTYDYQSLNPASNNALGWKVLSGSDIENETIGKIRVYLGRYTPGETPSGLIKGYIESTLIGEYDATNLTNDLTAPYDTSQFIQVDLTGDGAKTVEENDTIWITNSGSTNDYKTGVQLLVAPFGDNKMTNVDQKINSSGSTIPTDGVSSYFMTGCAITGSLPVASGTRLPPPPIVVAI